MPICFWKIIVFGLCFTELRPALLEQLTESPVPSMSCSTATLLLPSPSVQPFSASTLNLLLFYHTAWELETHQWIFHSWCVCSSWTSCNFNFFLSLLTEITKNDTINKWVIFMKAFSTSLPPSVTGSMRWTDVEKVLWWTSLLANFIIIASKCSPFVLSCSLQTILHITEDFSSVNANRIIHLFCPQPLLSP